MNPLIAKEWLVHHAMPLWLEKGVDLANGGFPENLSLDGALLPSHRRCMVQARQIYAFRTALSLGACDGELATRALHRGVRFLVEKYSLPSGAFRHSVTDAGDPLNDVPDLYGQAFALYGLAQGYAVTRDTSLVDRARFLLEYLRRERRAAGGGFTEFEDGKIVYRSNPLMHLFEAALGWMECDEAPIWRVLAEEILELCLEKFVDPETGALAERFQEGWSRELENDRFVYEPGHLCEWSWLMGWYQRLTGRDLLPVRLRLFELSERTGRDPERHVLYDQMWSDFSPRLKTSRFWPQCERIKVASQLQRSDCAHEGMRALFKYFELPVRGLWYDTREEDGTFREQPAKSSSLYHIIGAISEYQKLA